MRILKIRFGQIHCYGPGLLGKANGSDAPILQADENVKTPGTQTTFFREDAPENILRITLVQGNVRDETVVHFREDATSIFDSHADARKLANGIFNLSSMISNGTKLVSTLSLLFLVARRSKWWLKT